MAVNLAFIGGAGWQFFDDNGVPLSGGKIYTYAAGTTTPLTTYTSRDGLSPNTNPIILDAAGRTPQQIWSTEGLLYKYVVKTSDDVLIRTWDNIGGSVVSSNLAADLADTTSNAKGDALVGFKQSNSSGFLTGAVARTVNDKLQEVISVQDFGAVGDGITDDSAAFIAARTAAAGKTIYVPGGHYKLNQVLSSSEDLILEGDGPSTILDFTGAVSGGSYALDAVGTATQIQNLSLTATVGTNTITFATTPSLAIGDAFVIFNPIGGSWSGFRPTYFAGEWCAAESIVSNVVTVNSQLYDTYTPASVAVYRVSGPKVSLRNFEIRGTAVYGLMRASLCVQPLIENVTAKHANNAVLVIDRCYQTTVINPNFNNDGQSGDDYGIVIANSQHTKINGGNIYSRRHAIATGGGADVCSVPVRDARIIGATLKNDPASNIFTADFHGNTEDSSYTDCTIYGGASWQGKDVSYVNCTITADALGRVLYSAEIKGGTFALRNCKFTTYVNPQVTGRGIIDVGSDNDAITVNTVLPCTFIVEDCYVYARNLNTSTAFMFVRNRGTAVKLNSAVDGLTGDVNALNSILFTDNLSGTAAADFIIVDRISGFPSGIALHNANDGDYASFPHRCQKQTGNQTLTVTSGTNITLGSVQTFRYSYPRAPNAQVSAVSAFAGNVAALPTLDALTTTSIQPVFISADATNWTATVSRTLYWLVSLDEV